MSDPIAQAAADMAAAPSSTEPHTDAPAVAQLGEPAASTSQPAADTTAKSELPRESHLLLLEHKLAAMHAKFKTGERIVIDEFEQILVHIKGVL